MSTRKKFVIKQYKQPMTMDREAAQRTWHSLRDAIDQIHRQDASSLSFEELYRYAYNLVLHHHGDLLYNGVCETVRAHLEKVAAAVAASPDHNLLADLSGKWNLHKVTMGMIRDILMYMDRIYVVKSHKEKVYELGLRLFREVVLEQKRVQERVQELLLSNIRLERIGEVVDKLLMKNTLIMLVELGVNSTKVYEKHFETEFLRQTTGFYREEAQRFLAANTCPEYLFKAEARIEQERQRVADYLSSTSGIKLAKIVDRELVFTHAKALVQMSNSGLVPMLRDNKLDDLNRMYRLFHAPEHVELVKTSMAQHVTAEGEALVTDSERAKSPVEFVQRLLDMREKYDIIVREAFHSDKGFNRALKNSFEKFMNKDTRCAQFLSAYLNDLFCRGKGKTDEEVDSILDRIIVVFRYLQDKDIFESYYKTALQRRLLGKRSASDDWERSMIAKLKTECGFQFTSKLEGMFKDMRLSKELSSAYKAHRRKSKGGAGGAAGAGAGAVEVDVTVLTTGFWPAQAVSPCNLPPVVNAAASSFAAYYLSQHSGRRLTWQTNRGNAEIRAVYGDRSHILIVSTYQMCMLDLFNKADSLTFREISEAMNISGPECKRHLLSLTTSRNRILVNVSKHRDIEMDDVFQYNPKFSDKNRRVKVALVSNRSIAKKSGGAAVAVSMPAPVEAARRHLIEAAIVRIMKTRKTLDHNNLTAEVTKQLSGRFPATPQMIKQRIESLIEREYLERSPTDRRVFHYLA